MIVTPIITRHIHVTADNVIKFKPGLLERLLLGRDGGRFFMAYYDFKKLWPSVIQAAKDEHPDYGYMTCRLEVYAEPVPDAIYFELPFRTKLRDNHVICRRLNFSWDAPEIKRKRLMFDKLVALIREAGGACYMKVIPEPQHTVVKPDNIVKVLIDDEGAARFDTRAGWGRDLLICPEAIEKLWPVIQTTSCLTEGEYNRNYQLEVYSKRVPGSVEVEYVDVNIVWCPELRFGRVAVYLSLSRILNQAQGHCFLKLAHRKSKVMKG